MKIEVENIRVPDRDSIDDILNSVSNVIKEYDDCSINEFYNICGVDATPSVKTTRYGWFSTNGFKISKDQDGYVLIPPKAQLLS